MNFSNKLPATYTTQSKVLCRRAKNPATCKTERFIVSNINNLYHYSVYTFIGKSLHLIKHSLKNCIANCSQTNAREIKGELDRAYYNIGF